MRRPSFLSRWCPWRTSACPSLEASSPASIDGYDPHGRVPAAAAASRKLRLGPWRVHARCGGRTEGDGPRHPRRGHVLARPADSDRPYRRPAPLRARSSCAIWIMLPDVSFAWAMVEPVTLVGGILNSAPAAFIRS